MSKEKNNHERFDYINNKSPKTDLILDITEEEKKDYESGPPEYHISTYPADFTLEVLYSKWKKGDIEIPEFQRQFVWKKSQSSKLIESFLLGLPIPAVFLYIENETGKYLVIDGQQRLKSIFYFFEGYFGEEQHGKRSVFKLIGLNENSKWFNTDYENLVDRDKRKFNDSVLRAFVVNQLKPKDDTSIYHIFERLNTGGTLLSNQEVRNCIYYGKFNDMLKDINNYKNWRLILGKDKLDSRQKDVELILRFFSMIDVKKYTAPLKEHLSKYMIKYRNDEKFIKHNSKMFEQTCDKIIEYLGEKPFHIKTGVNTAVLETIMVAFYRNINKIQDDVKQKYETLKQDEKYLEYISGPITNASWVLGRFDKAEKILFG